MGKVYGKKGGEDFLKNMPRKIRTELGVKKRKELMIKALTSTMGIVTTACEMVNEKRKIYYKWMEDDENFRKQVEEITEREVDFAESALLKKIRDGDTTSIIFYLKTKGKKRGYVEKKEMDMTTEGKPITAIALKIISPKSNEATRKTTKSTED